MERENPKWMCVVCGGEELDDESSDGFFYCLTCNARAEGIIDTAIDYEDIYGKDGSGHGGIYCPRFRRPLRPSSVSLAVKPKPFYHRFMPDIADAEDNPDLSSSSLFDHHLAGGSEYVCTDRVTFEECYTEVRLRYVMGVQLMIQMQCEALVKEFKVCPTVCHTSRSIWFPFLLSSGVFTDDWAEEAVKDSELISAETKDPKASNNHKLEPHNAYGKRAVMICYRSLKKKIPLSYSLAVCFLCCHIAREPISPKDVLEWAYEWRLPYFDAFLNIENKFGPPSIACPLSARAMFKPFKLISPQKLESLAASIAVSIGLELPPVNFYAIASRFLTQLSVSGEDILPHACRIHEWLMPPDLWLSTNEARFPTRLCVMSILIVSIRVLYSLHGFGFWEKGLSSKSIVSGAKYSEDASHLKRFELRAIKLLMSFGFWDFGTYHKEISDQARDMGMGIDNTGLDQQKSNEDQGSIESEKSLNFPDQMELYKIACMQNLKLDMQKNMFCYIPPRVNVKRNDYLHYVNKKEIGKLTCAAHADYYILLRSCATVAQVEVCEMHDAVLSLERRLQWTESNIGHCLCLKLPNISR